MACHELLGKFIQQVMREIDIVALSVVHGTAHTVVAFAKAQIIGRVILGWFALSPVPAAAILNIHHVNCMAADNFAAGL